MFSLTSDRQKEWLIRQRAIHVRATCMSVTRIRPFVIVFRDYYTEGHRANRHTIRQFEGSE